MPWVDQQWFKQIATSLQHLDSKFDRLLKQENTMSQATDNLAAAVQRNTTLDQQILTGIHDLATQNQALTEQLRQGSNEPQVQALADQISANNDQLASAVASLASAPAPAAPETPATPA